jgi:TRAP-type C4-dicarboxylate transport system substrate-binding protein
MFHKIPADLQEILLRNGKKFMRELTLKSRKENSDAIQTLKKNGVQIVEANTPKALQEYKAAGKRARQSLVGKLYDQQFLDRVEMAVTDFRSKNKSSK